MKKTMDPDDIRACIDAAQSYMEELELDDPEILRMKRLIAKYEKQLMQAEEAL